MGSYVFKEKSCGTVLFTRADGTPRYLLIKSSRDASCGLPKGHVEKGETEEETALRETWEETSIKPRIINGFRSEISYPISRKKEKTVVFFLAEFDTEIPHHNPGFERYNFLLLPFEEAVRAISYENTRKVLRDADAFIKTHG